MGKRLPNLDGVTLARMIDHALPSHSVMVRCTCCTRIKIMQLPDLVALAERVGRDYSLVDRRCRCRLTEGCAGWNRFWWRAPWAVPLWTDQALERWMAGPDRM